MIEREIDYLFHDSDLPQVTLTIEEHARLEQEREKPIMDKYRKEWKANTNYKKQIDIDKEKCVEFYNRGISCEIIAMYFDCSDSTISKRLKSWGII